MLSVCQVDPPSNKNKSNVIGPSIPLTLPAILGRGPLLKCAETKVSRRHASIDWDDEDGITIQALHNNPTLVVVSGITSSLSKGDSLTLHHGDMFGLLPDRAWYRICLHDDKDTNSNGAGANGSASANASQENNTPLMNSTSINKEGKSTNQSIDANTIEQQTANNVSEQSSKRTLLPVETIATTSAAPSKDKQVKKDLSSQLDESKLDLDPNISEQAATPATTVSNTDGESSKKVPATRDDGHEQVLSPNKKSKLEVNGNLKNLAQPAVTHRVRALPAWMNNLNVAPSPAVVDGGTAKRGRKQGTSRARGGRAAAPSNKASNRLADEYQTAPKTPPLKNKREGKKPPHNSTKEQTGVSDPTSKPSSSSNSPAKPPSSSNTTPAKGNLANSTPVKHAVRQGNRLHYMSDSDSDDDEGGVTTSPVKTSSDVSPNSKQVTAPVAEAKKQEEKLTSNNLREADDVTRNNIGSRSVVDAVSDSGSEAETAPSTSHENRQGRVLGTGLAAATNAATATGAATAGVVKRKSCSYGASCYRRNPQHKRDEAHPGDADYASGPESGDAGSGDDDRPECEFGVDCYRKNPQHRRQFKHTRLPQPQRQAKRKVRAAKKRNAGDDVGDSDDSYDYDDPFLNDDSSDDYAPTDSGSDSERLPSQPLDEEEKRNLKRMKKEAKKFVKGD